MTSKNSARGNKLNITHFVMANGIRWNRDQLLILLNLYHKLRFGQMHENQPAVIDLADRMGRSPGSVAMKLVNLASFDPVLQMRGIIGLPGASKLDREIWDEYHSNPSEIIPLAQEKFDVLFTEDEAETTEVIPGKGIRRILQVPAGETETVRPAKQRRGQAYFRDIVLNNYDNRCALTGLPVRELLIASHILPWGKHEAQRLDVRNGISLNRLHDAAFDRHLVAFDDELRLILSSALRFHTPCESMTRHFEAYEGKPLILSEDGIPPDLAFLAMHRKKLAC